MLKRIIQQVKGNLEPQHAFLILEHLLYRDVLCERAPFDLSKYEMLYINLMEKQTALEYELDVMQAKGEILCSDNLERQAELTRLRNVKLDLMSLDSSDAGATRTEAFFSIAARMSKESAQLFATLSSEKDSFATEESDDRAALLRLQKTCVQQDDEIAALQSQLQSLLAERDAEGAGVKAQFGVDASYMEQQCSQLQERQVRVQSELEKLKQLIEQCQAATAQLREATAQQQQDYNALEVQLHKEREDAKKELLQIQYKQQEIDEAFVARQQKAWREEETRLHIALVDIKAQVENYNRELHEQQEKTKELEAYIAQLETEIAHLSQKQAETVKEADLVKVIKQQDMVLERLRLSTNLRSSTRIIPLSQSSTRQLTHSPAPKTK